MNNSICACIERCRFFDVENYPKITFKKFCEMDYIEKGLYLKAQLTKQNQSDDFLTFNKVWKANKIVLTKTKTNKSPFDELFIDKWAKFYDTLFNFFKK